MSPYEEDAIIIFTKNIHLYIHLSIYIYTLFYNNFMDNLLINISGIIWERKYLSVFYVQFENFKSLMVDPIIAHCMDFGAVLLIIY